MIKFLRKKSFVALIIVAMFGLQGCSSSNNITNSQSGLSKEEQTITLEKDINSSDSQNKGTEASNEAKLHFIDTGNSDAILVQSGGKYALIDGGDNDDGLTVLNYMKKQGVKELEYMFATHWHSDHIGGLDDVVDNIPVKNVFVSNGDHNTKTYSDFINSLANKGLYPSVPLLNSEFKLGDSTFKVVSVANTDDLNNNSIVLLFENNSDKVLLMGDAEADIESKLNVGKVDLLKVGHHGSRSSSSNKFIKNISPEYGVITVGKGNSYGHPHKESLETLSNSGVKIHRTDECKDIVAVSTGNGIKIECDKEGSLTPGDKNGGDSKKDNASASLKDKSFFGSSTSKTNKTNNIDNNSLNANDNLGEVVYYTKSGEVYHRDRNCSSFKNSKQVNQGSIAESGKSRGCKRCY